MPPKGPKAPKAPKAPKPKADDLEANGPPSVDGVFAQGWSKAIYDEVCRLHPENGITTTRFPPEPNGFLHIGHAKAIWYNFEFAEFREGRCYLRYDDTNPTKEEAQYFESIEKDVRWLGYSPFKITHSSDNFDRLYDLAEHLVRKDKAYVCFCTAEEINLSRGGKDNRGEKYLCKHRSRSPEENLLDFRKMKDGGYKPQEALLRFKMSEEEYFSGNPTLCDVAAYRVLNGSHHRTQDIWRIYPTYEFAHPLCDSLESITHSLCTLEFFAARSLYDWLINELREHLPARPEQREYSRLNITGTITSKRKILQLVEKGIVRNFDDPRLYTLAALRRRGVPPGAIRMFVAGLGVSETNALIPTIRLETEVRKYLEVTVPRIMLVPDPVLLVLENLEDDHLEEIEALFGKDPAFGSHTRVFTKNVWVDRSDVREEASEDFYRISPGKLVGLLTAPFFIEAREFVKDDAGRITKVLAKAIPRAKGMKGTNIHWVAQSPQHNSPLNVEVRMFNPLFNSEKPDRVDGGFLNDLNPRSEEIFPNAALETGFWDMRRGGPYPKDDKVGDAKEGRKPWDARFQGMRIAYFTEDTDSTDERLVFNKIVSLKEDNLKNA